MDINKTSSGPSVPDCDSCQLGEEIFTLFSLLLRFNVFSYEIVVSSQCVWVWAIFVVWVFSWQCSTKERSKKLCYKNRVHCVMSVPFRAHTKTLFVYVLHQKRKGGKAQIVVVQKISLCLLKYIGFLLHFPHFCSTRAVLGKNHVKL